MKKIMTAICIMVLCLSTMPVMASEPAERTERTINKGGMTFSFPKEYTSYTKSEFAALDIKEGTENTLDLFNKLPNNDTLRGWEFILGMATTLGFTWLDTYNEFQDNTELLIFDDAGNYAFEIFCMDDACMDLDDWAWYHLSRELLSDSPENEDRQLMNFLDDLGYYEYVTFSPDKAWGRLKKVEPADENKVPYLYIDERTNGGNACCRLAEIMNNGYENRVLFIDNGESELSEDAEKVFNDFMDSISITPSPNKPERAAEKYQMFLHDRVDITD